MKKYLLFLTAIICSAPGCILLPKRNYSIGDKPTLIETTHTIAQVKDSKVSDHSAKIEFLTYDYFDKQLEPYTAIEIVGMPLGRTSDSGYYSAIVPKGVYHIKIGWEHKYEIACIELLGGTATKVICYLGGTVWAYP
jgi:hypothetical protein